MVASKFILFPLLNISILSGWNLMGRKEKSKVQPGWNTLNYSLELQHKTLNGNKGKNQSSWQCGGKWTLPLPSVSSVEMFLLWEGEVKKERKAVEKCEGKEGTSPREVWLLLLLPSERWKIIPDEGRLPDEKQTVAAVDWNYFLWSSSTSPTAPPSGAITANLPFHYANRREQYHNYFIPLSNLLP